MKRHALVDPLPTPLGRDYFFECRWLQILEKPNNLIKFLFPETLKIQNQTTINSVLKNTVAILLDLFSSYLCLQCSVTIITRIWVITQQWILLWWRFSYPFLETSSWSSNHSGKFWQFQSHPIDYRILHLKLRKRGKFSCSDRSYWFGIMMSQSTDPNP